MNAPVARLIVRPPAIADPPVLDLVPGRRVFVGRCLNVGLNLPKDGCVARRHIDIWIKDDGTAIARDLGHPSQFLVMARAWPRRSCTTATS